LALSSGVNGPDPRNLINVIDQGIEPPQNSANRSMPAFRGSLSASDLADLLTFIRGHFSRKPAWPNVTADIARARSAEP
jgi:hypothetical protein